MLKVGQILDRLPSQYLINSTLYHYSPPNHVELDIPKQSCRNLEVWAWKGHVVVGEGGGGRGGGHSRCLPLNRAHIILGSSNFVKPVLWLNDETKP